MVKEKNHFQCTLIILPYFAHIEIGIHIIGVPYKMFVIEYGVNILDKVN